MAINQQIIDIKKIVKIFNVKSQNVLVLKEITTQIFDGDFVIIFGPSGCGKSTLLHIMLGLEPPTAGQISFLNNDLYKLSEDERSQFRKNHIGMVFQQPNWIKSLTVIENIAFATSLIGIEKSEGLRQAQRTLELVGMQNWADYYPTELSAGQQQRISFARAVVTDPHVIIADEPTGNLDYHSGIQVMDLFKKFNKQGKTVIMVSHNIDNVSYANKVIQMFNGNIVDVHPVTEGRVNTIKQKLISKKSSDTLYDNLEFEQSLLKKHTKIELVSRIVTRKINLPSLPQIQSSFKKIIPKIQPLIAGAKEIALFIMLLIIYLCVLFFQNIARLPIIPHRIIKALSPYSRRLYHKLLNLTQIKESGNISQLELIDLSLKNMNARKARSSITIGGMAIGISVIVFLVSIGYGLEKLVISRVARLEEMRQIDATPAIASNVYITDKTLASINEIPSVQKTMPVIGIVGKVNLNNSSTDVAVYGVLSDYLKESAIKPYEGKIFESNDLSLVFPISATQHNIQNTQTKRSIGDVAGAETEILTDQTYLDTIQTVIFHLQPGLFVRVRKEPNTKTGEVLGYTRRIEGIQEGSEVWGGHYNDNDFGSAGRSSDDTPLGKWIKAKVPLWKETPCTPETNSVCEQNNYTPLTDDQGKQLFETGYFAKIGVTSQQESISNVLGVNTLLTESTSSVTASSPEKLENTKPSESTDETDIVIQQLLENKSQENIKKITLNNTVPRTAVVNKSFLQVLGINSGGVGKSFKISFIATGTLVENQERIESEPVEYEIIGVTPDTKSPIVYVPILDTKQLGLINYSQLKVVVDQQRSVPQIRKQIEVIGLNTSSVIDTVSQIEQFFATVRWILGLLGVVALSVAALGMFNTLTISLLERTHEVGMMKAIGMKSDEVKDLFLTESMIMGVFGGFGGLFLGFIVGKIVSLLLTIFALLKGGGLIDISYIPPMFILLIIALSVFVGLVTGLYPSYRAKTISALNALRYE